jgi:hypothetical protein
MKEITSQMRSSCQRWRGQFSNYMNLLTSQCEDYDSSYEKISSVMSSISSNWSNIRSETEKNTQEKLNYYQKQRENNQQMLSKLQSRIPRKNSDEDDYNINSQDEGQF